MSHDKVQHFIEKLEKITDNLAGEVSASYELGFKKGFSKGKLAVYKEMEPLLRELSDRQQMSVYDKIMEIKNEGS